MSVDILPIVFDKPYGGEMAPTKFSNNCILAVFEFVTYMNRMITSLSIVFPVFFLVFELLVSIIIRASR